MDKTRKVAARIAGFTLAELMVILSILFILMGMLIPSFAAARRSAILASCGSNMHAVGIGLRQYASVNDERLPPFGFADASANLPQSSHWGGTQSADLLASARPEMRCSGINLWALMPESYLTPKHVLCPGASQEVRSGRASYFADTPQFSTYSLRMPYSSDLFRSDPTSANLNKSLLGIFVFAAGGQRVHVGMNLYASAPQARMDMPYAETPPGGTERVFQYVSGAVLSDNVWFDQPPASTPAGASCRQYLPAAGWCHANKFNTLFGGGDVRRVPDDGTLARTATASHAPAKDKDNFATPYLAAWRYLEDHK